MSKNVQVRPPIVTIMGHVDHGKTTLLDSLRHTSVTKSEAGGITQHIGAYQVVHNGNLITFIDTPGHAAFSSMRKRGAEITDIVVLVVAGTEGLKPQTVESIKLINETKIPCVVAMNKSDLVGFTPDMVKAQLTEYGILCEGYGGQVPAVSISALKNEGLDELLETISLVAEMEQLTADEDGELEAIVIETKQDKKKGPMASVIVKNGTVRVGEVVYAGDQMTKIRAMFDEYGKDVKEAKPGKPVALMGFKQLPVVGTLIGSRITDVVTADVIQNSKNLEIEESEKEDEIEGEIEDRPVDDQVKLPIIVKADTQGSLEAVIDSISSEIVILHREVGPINESDILLSQTTGAIVIGFGVPITSSAAKLAETESVNYKQFDIIYKLLEYLEKKVLFLLEPTINEEEMAIAKVLQVFSIRGEKIAGCKILSGEMSKKFSIKVLRDEVEIANTKIKSLKQGKEDIETVKSSSECGIILQRSIDIQVGDVIKSYRIISEI